MFRGVAIGGCLILAVSSICVAGANPTAKVAVHVLEHASRSCTKSFPSITKCQDIVYSTDSTDVDCFPVFFDLNEYQGFDYGLNWPGTYSCAFTSCSDLTIGDIVNPGDGLSHAWYSCQSGDIAVTGWAWISEPDSALVCIVDHPTAFDVNIGDCSGRIDHPAENPYCAGIAGAEGDQPDCGGPVANEQSTWGTVKSLFR